MKRRLVWLAVNCSYSHSSLALPMIHAACRDVPEWTWERMEITPEQDPSAVATKITEKECDLLCAHLYLFNRTKVMDILQRVHALSPSTHIAAGGPECPAEDAGKILDRYPFISTVFSGESEETFPLFLRSFDKLRRLRQNIPGDGNAVYGKWEDAPIPAADPFFRTDKPFVQIETSRGCPMACAYCTSSGVKQRYRSVDRVRRELVLLEEKGVKEIRVLDRTFNLPQERGAELLRLFGSFPGIRFHMEIHPQFLGEELRQCFREAAKGQFHVEAGMQSLDPAVQNAIGRRSDVEKAFDGVRFLASCPAFETHTDLLSGLPAQTLDSLKNDIVRLMSAAPAEIQLEVLKILPGTPVKKMLAEYGIVYSPESPYDVMRTSTMSAEEILYSRELSRLLDLFYNHPAIHPVMLASYRENSLVFLQMAEELLAAGTDLNTLKDLKKRLLFLQGFLGKRKMTASEEELSYAWIMAGYPAAEGPGKAAKAVHALPDKVKFCQGHEECRDMRETKYWCMKRGGKEWYFAFHRAFAFNKPCAVWQENP